MFFPFLHMIGNMTLGQDKQVMKLINKNLLPILKVIISHCDIAIRKETIGIIGNCILSSNKIILRITNEGFIQLSIEVYNKEVNCQIKDEIIIALSNTLVVKHRDAIELLISLGVIDLFCKYIPNGSTHVIPSCLEGFEFVLLNEYKHRKKGEGMFMHCLWAQNINKVLHCSKYHNNNTIKNKSFELLNDYFF